MNADTLSVDITLEPADNERLAELCGQLDAHLRQLEQRLGVEINSRGNQFRIIGEAGVVKRASQILQGLYLERFTSICRRRVRHRGLPIKTPENAT